MGAEAYILHILLLVADLIWSPVGRSISIVIVLSILGELSGSRHYYWR